MRLIKFQEQFKDKFFNVELTTGKVLKQVSINFPSDEADGFVIIKDDEIENIVNIAHIVRIAPYINTEIPLFSFS